MTKDHFDRWLSGAQAAARLGVSTSRIRQLRLEDELPGQLTATGYRYQLGDINRLAHARTVQPTLRLVLS